MLYYDFGETVESFTAGRDDVLPYAVTQTQQVHGIRIARVTVPGLTKENLDGFDALTTNVPGIAVGVRTADCVPVLLHDRRNGAVAAVHSGWKGTVKRISREVIYHMNREYGSNPADILAVIGPGICGRCFQVGEDVAGMFREAGFPMDAVYTWGGPRVEGDASTSHHIDLVAANGLILLQEGVPEENISVCGICTFEDESFYSARREGASCGRNINSIKLK